MQIAICDDELYFIKHLENHINAYSIRRNVDILIRSFVSLQSLMTSIDTFDVIFLDIRFQGKNEGIRWASKLRSDGNNTLIVICSSLKDQVIYGYEAEAIRFLLKPVSEKAVFDTLDVCFRKLNALGEQIIVKSNFGDTLISTSKILYVRSLNRQREIVLKDGSIVTTYETLAGIYDKMNHRQFKLSHKCFLVHLKMVHHIEKSTIYMNNGDKIPLSRYLRSEFKESLLAFVEAGIC